MAFGFFTNFNVSLNKSVGITSTVETSLRKSITKKKAVDVSLMKKNVNASKLMDGISDTVTKHLDKYKERCKVVFDKTELVKIVEMINDAGSVAIDTETMGLNPMQDDIVGVSLYCGSGLAYYIPINHVSLKNMRWDERQLSKNDIRECLDNISARVIMHNAGFDLRVLKHQLGLNLKVYWDTMIFNKLMTNGSGESNGLKNIYSKQVGDEKFLSFDEYFGKVTFNYIPIELGYIYASMDALMTFEIYKQQLKMINEEWEQALACYEVFRKIEMPIIRVVIEMEDAGVGVDLEYAKQLESIYNDKIEEAEREAHKELEPFEDEIRKYRLLKGADCKLTDPININSPLQIAIILYDILNIGVIDKKSPRGTGAGILEKIDMPFTNALLKVREHKKILTTYIETMPTLVNPNTGRIHTQFNQLGAVTGRFSSENPNLQNIPSSNKDIRKIFTASAGCCFISCDYSSQEPRIVSQLSHDPVMIKAFTEGLDYYATLGSAAYKKSYEECREVWEDGSPNPNGKVIRERAKRCYLGLCYGMMDTKLGEMLKISREEAYDLRQRVLRASPGLASLLDESVSMARRWGFVETYWGRRRYLPNAQLERYTFDFDKTKITTEVFDPTDFESDSVVDIKDDLIKKYLVKLNKSKGFKQFLAICNEAREEGIKINDNSGLIAEAERQAVNTRVQGSAADMTKMGMINIYKNKELKELGFRLLLAVHDELIGECPIENAKRCGELMQECMLQPVKDFVVPFKCDVEYFEKWYGEPLEV